MPSDACCILSEFPIYLEKIPAFFSCHTFNAFNEMIFIALEAFFT